MVPGQYHDSCKLSAMYIKDSVCISPQNTFPSGFPEGGFRKHSGTKYFAVEPSYEGLIAAGALRRMGKAVRMGVAAGSYLLKNNGKTDGILIGTANGGLEDCIKFLNQIVDYDEGTLTPTNFVQSTPNAIAGQLAMTHQVTGYNVTHAHGGLSFENALTDAALLFENREANVLLVGSLEEISEYNYNIDRLSGTFKAGETSSDTLLSSGTRGTAGGEGAAMFVLESTPSRARQVRISRVVTRSHIPDESITRHLAHFLTNSLPAGANVDGVMLGYNGDIDTDGIYQLVTNALSPETTVLSFKNACGEYPTASSFAVWAAAGLLKDATIPQELVVSGSTNKTFRSILVYNRYKKHQHSFILLDLHEANQPYGLL